MLKIVANFIKPWLIVLGLLLAACHPADPLLTQTRYMMGTLVEFSIYGVDKAQADAAIVAAAAAMAQVEAQFTVSHDSPVTRFNQGKGALPAEVGAVLAQAEMIRHQSGGAFHPALGGVEALWGFSGQGHAPHLPTAAAIARALPPAACVRKVKGKWQLLDLRCRLEFGAIAKGYAIDRGIAVLKAHHIANAIINAGGDMRILGSHGDRPWRIGVRHPRQADAVVATLALRGDISVVTSGDYERFFIEKGVRYHHILDPVTGYPAQRAISATVVADNATQADGWSTALFVLGAKGLPLLAKHGMAGMVVDADGKVHQTAGMKRWLIREKHGD
ncbi:MAG: FAD:protein FMN transferase [Mariprofundales bacterium]